MRGLLRCAKSPWAHGEDVNTHYGQQEGDPGTKVRCDLLAAIHSHRYRLRAAPRELPTIRGAGDVHSHAAVQREEIAPEYRGCFVVK